MFVEFLTLSKRCLICKWSSGLPIILDEDAGDTTVLRRCRECAIVYALEFSYTDLALMLLSNAIPPE